jgi:uncharacterized protein YjbI with pentapeptide repeats
MANEKHVEELRKGSDNWNCWRAKRRKITPDLRFARLSGSNLPGVNLCGTDLYGADLSRANLDSANIHGANLAQANLTEANLRFANLSHANLSGASLRGANFGHATVGWTIFSDVDLSEVKHLSTVTHYGPSSIGVDTLYRSSGQISEDFLRSCGLPDNFVTYIPTHINAKSAFQFYACFISFSHKDEEFANLLYARLRDADIRVWFAPEDMRPGSRMEEQIDSAIRLYDKLLLVLSEHSLNSGWVKTEIRKARECEREAGLHKLLPIRLLDIEALRQWKWFDADSGRDLANEVREYFIPDFSSWKNGNAFEQNFRRLLEALHEAQAPKAPSAL